MAVLAVVAVFTAGVFVGWWQALRSDPGRTPDTITVAAGRTGADGAVVVPDVRGLARVDALQAIVDAGIPAAAVDVQTFPSALAPDTVFRQDPPGGASFGSAVAVDIATAGTVPQAVGRPLTDVRAELEDLGAQVVVEYDYAATATSGSVLALDPPAGAPLTPKIRVVAAAPPGSVYVGELDAVSGGGSGGELAIGGVRYVHGLKVSSSADYLANRGVQRITGTVGVPDDGQADASATVVITGDGRELFRAQVGYGQSKPVNISVDGVLRIAIQVEGPAGRSVTAAFGDLLFVGRPDVIDALKRR